MTAHRAVEYLPIGEHGLVGDMHSAALVGTDGTIDWYCPERYDGPSVFAALLDRERGGFYRIAPTDPLSNVMNEGGALRAPRWFVAGEQVVGPPHRKRLVRRAR